MGDLTTGFTFGSSSENRTVTAARLNSAVNDATLNDGAVTASKLATNAVTSDAINTGAVTSSKLASDAVTGSKIGAGAVGTTQLATDAVTTVKITDANVTTAKIEDGAVTTNKLAADAVTAARIATGAVNNSKLAADAVTEDKIADGAITTDKLAADSVTAARIVTGAINTSKLATDSVTTIKILDENVTTAKLADEAVTADKIADEAITTAKLGADVSMVPAGALMPFFGSSAPSGRWLFANGKTIGGVSSSATALASAETEALFNLLWNSTADAQFPVEDSSGTPVGRGASAIADFNANRRIPLPDMRGRVAAGRDSMSNSAAGRLTTATGGFGADKNVLGASGGSELHEHSNGTLTALIIFTEADPSNLRMRSRALSPDWENQRQADITTASVGETSSMSSGAEVAGATDDAGTLQPMLLCNYIIAY